MKKIILGIIVLALIIGAMFTASIVGRSDFEQKAQATFAAMGQAVGEQKSGNYSAADFKGIPPSALAYLQKAMPPGGPRIARLMVKQHGRIKVAEDASWDDFTARQMITQNPPQMAWAAEAEYGPLMPMMTLIAYTNGSGSIRSYLWGLMDIFSSRGETIKRYLMLRWLAEAVWHPDALLPSQKLGWEAAKPPTPSLEACRVVLQDGGLRVSGRFIFTSRGGAPMMFLADAASPAQVAGQRWYCRYSDWRRQGKLQMPFAMVQGVRSGVSDDVRLKLKVDAIEFR